MGKDINQVAKDLVNEMLDEDNDLVSIYYGEATTEEQADTLNDMLTKDNCDIDVEAFYGGQPLYYYIISVE